MKIEFTRELKLADTQQVMLNMHSFFNIINILSNELKVLRTLAGHSDAFAGCLNVTQNILDSMEFDYPLMITQHQIQEFHSYFEQEIAREMQHKKISGASRKGMADSANNIRSLFSILHSRVRELYSRTDSYEQWVPHNINDLKQDLFDVFSAIQKNSKGRYRIVFKSELKKEFDYIMRFRIESVDGEFITMPPVIQDVFRDIIANARKYTDPGGKINALLRDDGTRLVIRVQDDGLGIPENEIENVIEYGYRAENVRKRPTAGGGFGLTKAYYFTKKLGGRFWIDSRLDKGTEITIHIPRP